MTYGNVSSINFMIFYLKFTESKDFPELVYQQPWLSTMKLVIKPGMLFGKPVKSGLVALNLYKVKEFSRGSYLRPHVSFVKERLGFEVDIVQVRYVHDCLITWVEKGLQGSDYNLHS